MNIRVPSHAPRPAVSVVIPVFDEDGSIEQLTNEVHAALAALEGEYEILFVDDGSRDATWEKITGQARLSPRVTGLRLSRNFGQTAALRAGIERSRGRTVVTMDGDLQNDPADIPRLLSKLEDGFEIVSGWRRRRQDRFLSRRFPSLLANALVRRLTRLSIHDQGCSLKAYQGDLLRSSALYSDFHRFIVPLTQVGGARVGEVETHHRARTYGRSKYGLGRTFRVLADLVTLTMVTRFADRLLLWFLAFAVIPLSLAMVSFLWTLHAVLQPTSTGMLVPAGAFVLLTQSVLAIFFQGLLAERIRQFAPSHRPAARRVVATVTDTERGPGRTFLIRGGKAEAIF